jgi:hypothetical protein
VIGLALYHNTTLGLPAFGIAVSISYAVYVLVCERTAGGRARYGLDKSYVAAVTVADLRAFAGEIGFVGFRSVFSTVRALVSPLSAIRLGVVEGSVYALLLGLQAPAVLLATASSGMNFIGARMIGAGEARAFTLFCTHYTSILTALCAVVCALLALAGRGVVVDRASDDERGRYRAIVGDPLWALAVAILPLRMLSTVVDNVLLATQDFKALAAAHTVAFAAHAVAVAVALARVQTVTAVYAADFTYYAVRVVVSGAYIRLETFSRKRWIVGAPVDDATAVYTAEAVAILDVFGNRCFKAFVLSLPGFWHVILIGIYRSMAADLRQASNAVRGRAAATIPTGKVEPLCAPPS